MPKSEVLNGFQFVQRDGDLQTLNTLIGATTLLVAYWGFRFGVLGVYVSARTREKVAGATGQDAPNLLEKLAKAVVKKK